MTISSATGPAAANRVTVTRNADPGVGASRLLGVNEATSRRWATHGVTGTAAILLRLMVAGKVSLEDVEAARSL
jgi:hypothetical protein